jgi:lysophospholipase L1-like esterase
MSIPLRQTTQYQTNNCAFFNPESKMKTMKFAFALTLSMLLSGIIQAQDWANTERFKNDNTTLGMPAQNENRIVFMGNSITEGWGNKCPEFFTGKPYINRGISGQTTPQMLVRFRPDVINLKPAVVVILAGTNDIAGNTGPSTLEMIADNIISMAELAKANGIKVILCSVLPAFDYPWKPGLNPAEKIAALNEMIKKYAAQNHIIYVDYYSAMVDERKGLKDAYTYDGVHPNVAGYKVMEPIVEQAIKKTLK